MKTMGYAGSALALVLSAPAAAQVTTEQAATAAAPQDDNASGTDDIVVTGEKINRTLQDTPASVGVTTQAAITSQNLISVYDVLERTPNVSVMGNRNTFSIRGIDAFSVSGGGDGALASVYVDGAVLPAAAIAVGPLDLYDIAQVEVFRGPQSTVQGRNALAGAVIIRTADPTYDWSGRARLLLSGPDGQRRAGAAIGGPIIGDQLAFRLAGEIARSDGVVRNVTLGRDGDARRSETIRGKLLFTPDAVPDLRVVATYLHDHHRRGTYFTELDLPYRPEDRITTEDVQDYTDVQSDIATLEVGYNLARGLTLNSVTNYSDIYSYGLFDPDRSATPGADSAITDPTKTFQQELRLNIDRGRLKGLVGAYYLREDNRDYYFAANQTLGLRRLGIDVALAGLGLPPAVVDAVLAQYGGVVGIRNSLVQPRLTHNYAGFFDLTYELTPRLHVTAGLRYDSESQDRGATQTVDITRPLPDPATVPVTLQPIVALLNDQLAGIAAGATSDEPIRRVTYHAWLPKIGVTYDIATDVSASATAQRGYRAGGAGINQQRAEYFQYDPEYTWNYEVALRSEFLDRRLTVNANIFYIDWRDQQVVFQLTPGAVFDSQTVNAGKSRLYGGELSISARPVRTLTVNAGVGYTNTKFLEFDVPAGASDQGAAENNEFANAPHWTLSGSATWQASNGLFANVNAYYRAAYYQDTVVQTRRDIRSLTVVGAKLGYQGRQFGAFLVASNIFNVEQPLQTFADFDGRNRAILSDPRIIGLSFEGRF